MAESRKGISMDAYFQDSSENKVKGIISMFIEKHLSINFKVFHIYIIMLL